MKCDLTCEVFGRCGGCSELNVPYDVQLRCKDTEIAGLYADLVGEGAVAHDAIRPILGMAEPCRYRNKVIAPLVAGRRKASAKADARRRTSRGKGKFSEDRSTKADGQGRAAILTGMYARGTHRVIAMPAEGCILENPVAHRVVEAVRAIMQKHDIAPYDEDAGTGFLRHVVVRVGHGTGEVLVTLVTNAEEFPYAKSFCRELMRRVPAITTVVQSVNLRQTNVVLGDREHTLYGPGFILDDLCGLRFRISSHSFYQVNAAQTEVLYENAIRMARLCGNETVLDAYCGTGTIGLVAAARGAGRVIGVDSSASAIRDARLNARHNGIENAEFVTADATAFMEEFAARGRDALVATDGPLTLFMDPPRAGSSPEFLQAVARLRPMRVVYVSCNPKTHVRDLKQLCAAGYEVDEIQPVDMFPHTPHIECIASLGRRT